MRAHQRRLKDVEGHPPGERGGMNPEKKGPRQSWMEQVGIYGVAEAPDHNGRNEQRHKEIKILVQQPVPAGYRTERTRDDFLRHRGHGRTSISLSLGGKRGDAWMN